eukprot:TRINITY_DN1054_c0_g1_i5.p1 TRINITY_DN1054_c0_g1~~TRINITY_DN1054_c0_g1_i5.p1  ORF type:complete len:126 (-),score=25.86 TRINITY_DN1054_c0_g1_i5:205-582(-)
MLTKQKQYTKTKKAEVANMKIAKEYNMKPIMNYKGIIVPVRPPKIVGYIMKIGKMLGGKNRRYFAMDPIEGSLIKYMRKSDFPKKPKDIYCLANTHNLMRVPSSESEREYSIKVNFSFVTIVHTC